MPAAPDMYRGEIDFTALSLQYPEFAKRLKSNRQLDFTDPESVRQLTKALLQRDFDLQVTLPDDRLCPPVPNRFNYVVFLQKLLDSTQRDYAAKADLERRVVGIDIGTGASAIYPLLACRQRPQWYFLATEIDDKSRGHAIKNVEVNSLTKRIRIIEPDHRRLIPSSHLENLDAVGFLMTNPPFYASESELENLAKQKARPPNSACTGAPVEMVCPGGEVAFVSQLIEESQLPENRAKIQWFSSMFGKLGSVNMIIDKLKDCHCTNFAVTEFVQGQKTRRWCVAWSWLGLRPPQSIARGTDAVEKKCLPFPAELDISLPEHNRDIVQDLGDVVGGLPGLEWFWNPEIHAALITSVDGDVWSRSARRKHKKHVVDQIDKMQIHEDVASSDGEDISRPKLVVRITPQYGSVTKTGSETTSVRLQWVEGHDAVLFESFHGWLKRKLLT